MDARATSRDRHRYQDHAGKAAKNTHGRDEGKRDARMIRRKSAHCATSAP
jgi:hypothetical protein